MKWVDSITYGRRDLIDDSNNILGFTTCYKGRMQGYVDGINPIEIGSTYLYDNYNRFLVERLKEIERKVEDKCRRRLDNA